MEEKKFLPLTLDKLVKSTFLQMSCQSEEFFARMTWEKFDGVYRRVREPYPSDYILNNLAAFQVVLLMKSKYKVASAFYEAFKSEFDKVGEKRTFEYLDITNYGSVKLNQILKKILKFKEKFYILRDKFDTLSRINKSSLDGVYTIEMDVMCTY